MIGLGRMQLRLKINSGANFCREHHYQFALHLLTQQP